VTELGFPPVALGDILERDECRRPSLEHELVRVDLDVDEATVLEPVRPLTRVLEERTFARERVH
jgi:hypothetical protein